MSRKSHRWDLLVWSCFFLAVESQQGSVLPPQNLSLLWVTGFQPQLSWAPPQHSVADCTYDVSWENKRPSDGEERTVVTHKELFYVVMEGGFLNMTVKTVCGGTSSEPAWLSVNHPELVRNLKCYISAATKTHCSWEPASGPRDIRFFYWLLKNDFSQSTLKVTLEECSAYNSSGGVRTGCDLEANIDHIIHILFNGTVNNTLATNTFEKKTAHDVRPAPLDFTVTKTKDKFLFNWTRPEIKGRWTYIINYTECHETKTIELDEPKDLDRVHHCAYRFAIKAIWYAPSLSLKKKAETPYSDAKYFEADKKDNNESNASLLAAIIIPAALSGLAVLVLVCCRKNKEYIFPKVPEPRDLLSDISNNNNNKGTDHSLYVPAEEGDNCEITLVVDPLINKL